MWDATGVLKVASRGVILRLWLGLLFSRAAGSPCWSPEKLYPLLTLLQLDSNNIYNAYYAPAAN